MVFPTKEKLPGLRLPRLSLQYLLRSLFFGLVITALNYSGR